MALDGNVMPVNISFVYNSSVDSIKHYAVSIKENAVPDVIRKSEMDKILLFMSSQDKDEVLSNYKLVEKKDLTPDKKI